MPRITQKAVIPMAGHRGRKFALFAVAAAVLAPPSAVADDQQFELGRRLTRLEQAWRDNQAPALRRAAVPHLNAAMRSFLLFQNKPAMRSLDRARFCLQSGRPPEPANEWLGSLKLSFAPRAQDASTTHLDYVIEPAYPSARPADARLTATVRLEDAFGRTLAAQSVEIDELPHRGKLSWRRLGEGDYRVVLDIEPQVDSSFSEEGLLGLAFHPDFSENRYLYVHYTQPPRTLSRIGDLRNRLDHLRGSLSALTDDGKSQWHSLHLRWWLLHKLATGSVFETNFAAAELLRETEAALAEAQQGRSYFAAPRTGDHWMALADSRRFAAARLLAPPQATGKRPLPLVIALHGSGGSENMFFEAYGGGRIVELCRRRGWLLVSPELTFLGLKLPLEKIITAVEKIYPVDRSRIMVVGHSLGAAQAILAAQRSAIKPAAVAALGGSGFVRKPVELRGISFFVGVGEDDFLRGAVQRLRDVLRAARPRRLVFREYARCEHIMIVNEALDDVFAFFEEAVAKHRASDVGGAAERRHAE